MKKHKSFLIPALCVVLAAGSAICVCAADNPRAVARTNEVTKDNVHADGTLTKRELKDIKNNLNDIGYYGFLLSDYDDPKYIDWNEVFYNGAGFDMGETTKIRNAFLKQTGGDEIMGDLTVVSGEDVRDYVKETTGVPYTKMKNQLDWIYLKSQDVYCFDHGDTNKVNVDVISGYVEDGVYYIKYTHENWYGDNADSDYEVCFTMGDEYYCFISNTPVKSSGKKSEYIGGSALLASVAAGYVMKFIGDWHMDLWGVTLNRYHLFFTGCALFTASCLVPLMIGRAPRR